MPGRPAARAVLRGSWFAPQMSAAASPKPPGLNRPIVPSLPAAMRGPVLGVGSRYHRVPTACSTNARPPSCGPSSREYIATAQPVGSSPRGGHRRRARLAGHHPQRDGAPGTGGLPRPAPHQRRSYPDRQGLPRVRRSSRRAGPLSTGKRQLVRDFFAQAHGELEAMLHDTSQLLSSLTDYAGVVVGPPSEEAQVRSAQLVSLSTARRAAGGRAVQRRRVEARHRCRSRTPTRMRSPRQRPRRRAPARPYRARSQRRPRLWRRRPSTRWSAPRSIRCTRKAPADMFVGGTSQLRVRVRRGRCGAPHPACPRAAVRRRRPAARRARARAVGVDRHRARCARRWRTALSSSRRTRSTAEPAGTIAVLGPTRMNYPEAMAAVAIVSERLGRRLTTG